MASTSVLKVLAYAFATIFTGFGINAIIRPASALTFFEFSQPIATTDRQMVNSLMVIYGARDIFMGLSIYAAAILGTRKSLGWTLVAASAVAFIDGIVCWSYGNDQRKHWGYAPIITAVGCLFLGLFSSPSRSL